MLIINAQCMLSTQVGRMVLAMRHVPTPLRYFFPPLFCNAGGACLTKPRHNSPFAVLLVRYILSCYTKSPIFVDVAWIVGRPYPKKSSYPPV
jgi:hypothetical protein